MTVIRPVTAADREWIRAFIAQRWGSELIVGHGQRFYPHELPGLVAEQNGEVAGLLTYHVEGSSCEVVTIDAIRQGIGVGTQLIEAAREEAIRQGCDRLWLITTNDNVDALRFYQTRGFRLAGINVNAIEESRKIKPQISAIGNYGIPIRDEIVLEMPL